MNNFFPDTHIAVERTRLSRKLKYHFAIFAINEKLILKDHQISAERKEISF